MDVGASSLEKSLAANRVGRVSDCRSRPLADYPETRVSKTGLDFENKTTLKRFPGSFLFSRGAIAVSAHQGCAYEDGRHFVRRVHWC